MAKFMLTLPKAMMDRLLLEADQRDISIQELIRAVIVGEWAKTQQSLTSAALKAL